MNVEPDQVGQARGSAAALERAMGIQFRDSSLLGVALTHRSTLNEHPELSLEDNERLEFLGDAVIGAVVADQLYQAFPAETEGALTLMRAQLVRQSGLARWARDLDLGRYLVLGRGEDRRGGRERDGLLSSAFEALVGAIYLDRGFAAAQEMLMPLVAESLPSLSPSTGGLDAKSELQHRVQAQFRSLPVYEVMSVEGPEHRPTFTVAVAAEGGVSAQGVGASKHAAEQDAAQRALEVWDAQHSYPADHPCT